MGRLNTITESNGPDRFNRTPVCSKHHAGVKTGISDSCCCCDPCSYVRKVTSADQPEDRFCCRCIPRIILAKFTASVTGTGTGTGADCCRNAAIPMVANIAKDGMSDVIEYSGTLVGYAITVYLSNNSLTGTGSGTGTGTGTSGRQCMWTILIPELGINEEIPIDHYTVTCLGVPSISVTNVVAFESCVGTISLTNYSTVKVPFQVRDHVLSGVQESHVVPFPEGYSCPGCTTLPRYICVTKKHNRTDRIRAHSISWEIDWWKEFVWVENVTPYIVNKVDGTGPVGTGLDQDEELVIGRWIWESNDPDVRDQYIYLIKSYDGDCYLQPDFNSPDNTTGVGETYQRVSLSNCGCDFKILNVRPVNDLNPPDVPGEVFPSDLVGIDLRGGRCGCWDYQCGKRRCVPRYLCGYFFLNNVLYKDILFEWDNATKSWVSTSGVGLDELPMPFTLSVTLGKSVDGSCQLEFSFEDFSIDPVAIDNTSKSLNATFEGRSDTGTGGGTAGDGFLVLHLETSFDGECKQVFTCVTATPCAANCGHHPEILHLKLRGYSTASDIPPPPITGECITEIEMIYTQSVVVTATGVLITCLYTGYALVDSYFFNTETSLPDRGTFVIKVELALGQLKIYRKKASSPDAFALIDSAALAESCDPYYGYKLTTASLRNCFFGDQAIVWHRWEAEVTE